MNALARRVIAVLGVVGLILGITAMSTAEMSSAATPAGTGRTASSASAVIMTVGDIACDPNAPAYNNGNGTPAGCRQKAVGDAVRSQHPDAFLPLGDIQYFDGRLDAFQQSYDPAFGDLKSISYPIPGNHEYKTTGGAGYYTYFGASAHQDTKGTYSFDIGGWHVLAINSVACTPSTPCGPGSAMAKWIAADVATHPSQCVMAMWHHPLWSAGAHGDYLPFVPVWNQLNSYGVDLVLNGHDHLYQRYKPAGDAHLDANGNLLPPTVTNDGMVEIVAGMGGEDNYKAIGLANPAMADALAAVGTNPNPGVFGALRMDTRQTGLDFSYIPAANSSNFSDSGSLNCRTKTPPTGIPAKPSVSKLARTGDGTVTVSWDSTQAPGTPATSFTVNAVGTTRKCVTSGSSCAITGLSNGRQYQFTVTADNLVAAQTSEPSDPFLAANRPGRPSTPSVSLGQSSATLAWAAPTSDGGQPITGYTATASPGGKTCTTAGELTCTVTDLIAGTSYSFSVTATNSVGTSASSVGSTPVTAVVTGLPLAPSVASLARAGDGQVAVTVTPAADDGGSPVTGYVVTSAPLAKTCAVATPATSCVVSGLTNGSSYRFTAVAFNTIGRSKVSAPSDALVAGRKSTRPQNVSATPLSLGAAKVAWSPPDWNGGLPVTKYTVTANAGGAGCVTTDSLTCTVTGMPGGVSRSFTVTATNDAGNSLSSVGSNTIVIKGATVPAPPSVTSAARAGDGAVTVTVAAPGTDGGSPITSYVVTSAPGGKRCAVAVPATACAVSGLTNGTAYTFTATAVNSVGASPASAPSAQLVAGRVPTRPTAVTGKANGKGAIAVSWTAPDWNGGLPITSYLVTANNGGKTCTTSGALTCTVTGLTAGASYSFTVAAINDAGSGLQSVGSAAVNALAAPSAPSVVSLARAGDGMISVTVGAPATDGGSPVTGYTVTSSPGLKKCTIAVPATSCVVSGLTNGTAYSFTATAISAVDASAASAPSPTLVAARQPTRPANVVATAQAGGIAVITWTAPDWDGGALIANYTAQSNVGSKVCHTFVPFIAPLTCTATGLTAGTSYSFTVTATNDAGTSLPSVGSVAIKGLP